MSDLIVLAFDNEGGALEMRDKLLGLQKQKLIELEDAAVVIRGQDGKAKVKQATSLVGEGALGGAFWGMLIGLIFFMPWLGLAIGAMSGALGGAMSDIGVDDKFIKEVSDTIEPGHSALFLLVREVQGEKVMDEVRDFGATVLQTSLSKEDDEKLREAFGAHDIDA